MTPERRSDVTDVDAAGGNDRGQRGIPFSAERSLLRRLSERSDVRLALFGLAAVTAVYVGFLAVPVQAAETFVKRGGYYVMLGTFALFLHALWRLWSTQTPSAGPLTWSQRWLTTATILVLSSIAIAAEPFHSKILNDEFVLQSTAFNMHYFRDVATMVRGYEIQGVFLSTDNYLDKRPYFYPFVVSLVHDLTGYRVLNAYVVNSVLLPAALWLVFVFCRSFGGWRSGMLGVLLLGSLPLLGQNATGSGMELLNFTMIMASLVLGAHYLRAPDAPRLAAFALCVVLLAQSRYESALYAAPAALIILLGWVRLGRVLLPWQAILLPLLLVPCALQNKVLSNSPVLWELSEDKAARFSFDYVATNLRGALSFLFTNSPERANSLLLSAVGLGALLWGLGRGIWRIRALRTASASHVALGCFSLAIMANTVLVFFYYWSNFDDPMASRFSLPLHLLMALAAVSMAIDWDPRIPATRALIVIAALWSVCVFAGKEGHHYYSHLGIDEIEWQKRFVNSLPAGERIVLTNRSSLPWLLQKTPSILIGRARLVADRLRYQLSQPTFREILVFQSLKPTTVNGDHQLPPEEALPSYFKLELLAERRFGTKITRVSRLVDVQLPANWQPFEKSGESPAAKSTKRGPGE